MPRRVSKATSSSSLPASIPPKRPVLESLRLPGAIVLPLPQLSILCPSRPHTPCDALSQTNSLEEEGFNADSCCNLTSCSHTQTVRPFDKKDDPSEEDEEGSCKGPCQDSCKKADAATETAIRIHVDHQISAHFVPLQTQSLPCFPGMQIGEQQESTAQMSSEVPLCCRPQVSGQPDPGHASATRASPAQKLQNARTTNKSRTASASSMRNACCTPEEANLNGLPPVPVLANRANNANKTLQKKEPSAASMKKTCCPPEDATVGGLPPVPAQPSKANNIANGVIQKIAATSCPQKDKKRKSETKLGPSAGTCNHERCPAHTTDCPCRFPPAFSQFECAGNITGTCNCAQNK